ncbi:MAG: aldehyde ferredoxin oxidoreductase family protein, partial [Dehalococcoidales bacterium]|nr:aldehyde ferredoxin oxidoreductase family protein [Dehalococcoidales bacterium]
KKVLVIDLSKRSYHVQPIDDEIYTRLLGGKGLATQLLLEHTKAGVDPLSPENVLIFATGPVTDTSVWGSSRYGVYTKSPLTGIYCESYSGGHSAEPMSRTGYDAFVIKGASAQPVYLEISDGKVEFHDAVPIWGKETFESEAFIRNAVNKKEAAILTIGPAAERGVKFSVIANDRWRAAGRAGAGTVMGSKKLKGLAFYGEQTKTVAYPEELDKFWKEMSARSKTDKGVQAYRTLGTPMLVALTNKAGAFPTKYWSKGTFEKWPSISADALHAQCKVKPKACSKCFMACGRLTEIVDGRHKGLVIEGPEYETINAFGGLCMIDDIREIAYLNDLCDRLGMDTITAGNLAGFTIEASKRKAINEKIDYGDVDAIAELLNKIANRQGIGAVLAEGVRYAAKEWGLEDIAVHVKGLEPPGYEPRVLKGMGLAFAVSDRGACHLRATVYKPELTGTAPPGEVAGKAELLLDFEDRHTIFDTMILCRFYRDFYPWELISLMVRTTTGLNAEKPQLREISANIRNKIREFNTREGMVMGDNTLPKRFFAEALEDSGKKLSREELDKMLSDYYKLTGGG